MILSYYESDKRKFICFQIKSHGDLKEKNYLKNIKAQYADSKSKFDFVDYYLIIATDEKAEKDKIRSIKAELSKYDKLTIVDPSQFLFLLSLKSSQVGSIIKSFLFQGDILIKKSLDIIKGLIRPQRILIFCLLDLCIRNGFKPVKFGDIFDSEQLREAYESYSEENDISTFSVSLEESVTSYLEALNNAFFEADFDNQIICPDFIFMQPLVALILEGIIRYEFNNEEIIEYLEGLLSI